MALFKRNQIEEAISRAVVPTDGIPPGDLLNRLKRLLDTDRKLGRDPRSKDPEKSTYAFYSGSASGSGVENWFQEYEAFALLTALRFLEHGFPQQKSVSALRAVRPELEQEHARLLRLDPKALFDQEAIRKAARPGQLAVSNTDPVFLVISSESEARTKADSAKTIKTLNICRGELQMMKVVKATLGPKTIFEIVNSVHQLHHYLSIIEPSQRGRAAN